MVNWFQNLTSFLYGLLESQLLTFIGFVLALLIIGRMINEKREPSNFFAWSLIIVFVPLVGVPLYFLFGGRKSRRLARIKAQTNLLADKMRSQPGSTKKHYQAAEGALPPEQPTRVRDFGIRSSGNLVVPLMDETTAYRETIRQIREARHSIHLMTYILGPDQVGRAVVSELARRAAEGLDVRLLLDAFGSLQSRGRFCDPLRKAGGQVVGFMPVLPLQTRTSANLRNHRKLLIADRQRVLIGGQNIDRRFMSEGRNPESFVDFSVRIDGPAAAEFNRIFISDWVFAAGTHPREEIDTLRFQPAPVGESKLKVIPSGPDVTGDPLYEQLLMMIHEARQCITLVTPYFLPDDVMLRSLIVKAHLGREVTVIVPERSNKRIVDFASNHPLRQLHHAGVRVRFYRPRMLHAKLAAVDDQIAVIGSANIDPRSLFVNFEVGVVLLSQPDVDALVHWTNRILEECVPYMESRRAHSGPSRRLLEDFAHLLVPLL